MQQIRAAVVGVGYLGRFHAQKYKALSSLSPSRVQLAGIYDADAARAAIVAKELGVRVFSKCEDLLTEVDAVTIASSTPTHFELARFFLSQGKHVNVEKPMTVTLEEASELVELAKKKGLQLAVGQSERFNPAFQFLKQRFQTPSFLELKRHAPFRRRGSEVSVVLDLMVHDLDMVLQWNPGPLDLLSVAGGRMRSSSLDWAECVLKGDKTLFSISVSRVGLKMSRMIRGIQDSETFQTDFQTGECEILDWAESDSSADTASESPRSKENRTLEKADHLLLETEAFLDAIRKSRPLVVTGGQGSEVLRWALKIEDAIRASEGSPSR